MIVIKKGIVKRLYNGRVIAFYIDGFIFTIIPFVYLFFSYQGEQNQIIEGLPVIDSEKMAALQLIMYFIYFSLTEYFFGKTLGKKILGYKVMVQQRTKLSFWNFLLRTLIRLNPLDKLLYVLTGEFLLWHEKWSGINTVKSPAGASKPNR